MIGRPALGTISSSYLEKDRTERLLRPLIGKHLWLDE